MGLVKEQSRKEVQVFQPQVLTICSMRASVTYMICLPAPYLVVIARQMLNATKKTWSETLSVAKCSMSVEKNTYPS